MHGNGFWDCWLPLALAATRGGCGNKRVNPASSASRRAGPSTNTPTHAVPATRARVVAINYVEPRRRGLRRLRQRPLMVGIIVGRQRLLRSSRDSRSVVGGLVGGVLGAVGGGPSSARSSTITAAR